MKHVYLGNLDSPCIAQEWIDAYCEGNWERYLYQRARGRVGLPVEEQIVFSEEGHPCCTIPLNEPPSSEFGYIEFDRYPIRWEA